MESDRLQHLYLQGVRPNGVKIGVGAYGRVFEVDFCGDVFATKEIHPALIEGVEQAGFERMKRMFIDECHQSSAFGHRNVVCVLGVYNPGGESALLPVLVMERMQESLTSLVEKYPNIPMCVKFSMLVDVSKGLWYLHSHNPPIVHRDLSPNNILLTSKFVAKISDLGVAKVIRADSKKTKPRAPGTVDFMGPEALAEIPEYGPPLDVFSYGGVILHLVNQEWPKPLHYVMTDPKTRRRVALSEVERRQERVEKMRGAPVNLKHLVEQCLDDDPAKRPPISDVSERMRRMKEAENVRCPDVTMNPITWQVEQATRMLRNATISPSADIFNNGVEVKWEELAPLPVGRTGHMAVLLHGSVYVGGGSTGRPGDQQESYRLDVYNLSTNQWGHSPIITPYCYYSITILDDKLIIAGGWTRNDKLTNEIHFLYRGQWRNYNNMPTARCHAAAVAYQSLLIVVGGQINDKGIWTRVATTELLDTTTGCWYTCNDLPAPHSQLKLLVLEKVLHILGGADKDGKPSPLAFTASLDNLSSHQLKWQSLPDTPWGFSTPVLYNKFLLTVGGRQLSDCNGQTSEVCAFNPSTGVWNQIANVPGARNNSAVVGVADNSIIVLGGKSKENEYSVSVWVGLFE